VRRSTESDDGSYSRLSLLGQHILSIPICGLLILLQTLSSHQDEKRRTFGKCPPGRRQADTFSGIRPTDVPGFIAAQLVGFEVATALFSWLVPSLPAVACDVLVPHVLDSERISSS